MLTIRMISFHVLTEVQIEKPDIEHEFNLDDRVWWVSCGMKKIGTVVAIIPPLGFPPCLEELPGYTFRAFGAGRPRREVSYLIAKDLKFHARVQQLYWPVTKLLHKA